MFLPAAQILKPQVEEAWREQSQLRQHGQSRGREHQLHAGDLREGYGAAGAAGPRWQAEGPGPPGGDEEILSAEEVWRRGWRLWGVGPANSKSAPHGPLVCYARDLGGALLSGSWDDPSTAQAVQLCDSRVPPCDYLTDLSVRHVCCPPHR